MTISMTEKAAEGIQGLMRRHHATATACLRVSIRKGGCAEMSYILDVTDEPRPEDETFTSHGVRIVCDPKSFIHLDGTEIDYDDTLVRGGFVFRNPHARIICRCGSSFAV